MLHIFPDLCLGRARENAGYGRREASDRREAFRHFPHRAARFFKSDLAFVRRNKAFPGVRRRTRKYPELRARREHRAHHDKLRAVFGQRGRTERKYGKRHRHRKCGERRKRNTVLPQKPCDKRRGKYRGDQRRLKRERCGKRYAERLGNEQRPRCPKRDGKRKDERQRYPRHRQRPECPRKRERHRKRERAEAQTAFLRPENPRISGAQKRALPPPKLPFPPRRGTRSP